VGEFCIGIEEEKLLKLTQVMTARRIMVIYEHKGLKGR